MIFFNIFNLFRTHVFIVQCIDLEFRSMHYITIDITIIIIIKYDRGLQNEC